jgi:hypothetical protein
MTIEYKVINHIDEKARMTGLPDYYITNKPNQYDSHGYIYIYCRELYKEMN